MLLPGAVFYSVTGLETLLFVAFVVIFHFLGINNYPYRYYFLFGFLAFFVWRHNRIPKQQETDLTFANYRIIFPKLHNRLDVFREIMLLQIANSSVRVKFIREFTVTKQL